MRCLRARAADGKSFAAESDRALNAVFEATSVCQEQIMMLCMAEGRHLQVGQDDTVIFSVRERLRDLQKQLDALLLVKSVSFAQTVLLADAGPAGRRSGKWRKCTLSLHLSELGVHVDAAGSSGGDKVIEFQLDDSLKCKHVPAKSYFEVIGTVDRKSRSLLFQTQTHAQRERWITAISTLCSRALLRTSYSQMTVSYKFRVLNAIGGTRGSDMGSSSAFLFSFARFDTDGKGVSHLLPGGSPRRAASKSKKHRSGSSYDSESVLVSTTMSGKVHRFSISSLDSPPVSPNHNPDSDSTTAVQTRAPVDEKTHSHVEINADYTPDQAMMQQPSTSQPQLQTTSVTSLVHGTLMDVFVRSQEYETRGHFGMTFRFHTTDPGSDLEIMIGGRSSWVILHLPMALVDDAISGELIHSEQIEWARPFSTAQRNTRFGFELSYVSDSRKGSPGTGSVRSVRRKVYLTTLKDHSRCCLLMSWLLRVAPPRFSHEQLLLRIKLLHLNLLPRKTGPIDSKIRPRDLVDAITNATALVSWQGSQSPLRKGNWYVKTLYSYYKRMNPDVGSAYDGGSALLRKLFQLLCRGVTLHGDGLARVVARRRRRRSAETLLSEQDLRQPQAAPRCECERGACKLFFVKLLHYFDPILQTFLQSSDERTRLWTLKIIWKRTILTTYIQSCSSNINFQTLGLYAASAARLPFEYYVARASTTPRCTTQLLDVLHEILIGHVSDEHCAREHREFFATMEEPHILGCLLHVALAAGLGAQLRVLQKLLIMLSVPDNAEAILSQPGWQNWFFPLLIRTYSGGGEGAHGADSRHRGRSAKVTRHHNRNAPKNLQNHLLKLVVSIFSLVHRHDMVRHSHRRVNDLQTWITLHLLRTFAPWSSSVRSVASLVVVSTCVAFTTQARRAVVRERAVVIGHRHGQDSKAVERRTQNALFHAVIVGTFVLDMPADDAPTRSGVQTDVKGLPVDVPLLDSTLRMMRELELTEATRRHSTRRASGAQRHLIDCVSLLKQLREAMSCVENGNDDVPDIDRIRAQWAQLRHTWGAASRRKGRTGALLRTSEQARGDRAVKMRGSSQSMQKQRLRTVTNAATLVGRSRATFLEEKFEREFLRLETETKSQQKGNQKDKVMKKHTISHKNRAKDEQNQQTPCDSVVETSPSAGSSSQSRSNVSKGDACAEVKASTSASEIDLINAMRDDIVARSSRMQEKHQKHGASDSTHDLDFVKKPSVLPAKHAATVEAPQSDAKDAPVRKARRPSIRIVRSRRPSLSIDTLSTRSAPTLVVTSSPVYAAGPSARKPMRGVSVKVTADGTTDTISRETKENQPPKTDVSNWKQPPPPPPSPARGLQCSVVDTTQARDGAGQMDPTRPGITAAHVRTTSNSSLSARTRSLSRSLRFRYSSYSNPKPPPPSPRSPRSSDAPMQSTALQLHD